MTDRSRFTKLSHKQSRRKKNYRIIKLTNVTELKSALHAFRSAIIQDSSEGWKHSGISKSELTLSQITALLLSVYQLIQSNQHFVKSIQFEIAGGDGALHNLAVWAFRRREKQRGVWVLMVWGHKKFHSDGPHPLWHSNMAQAVNRCPNLPALESYDRKNK